MMARRGMMSSADRLDGPFRVQRREAFVAVWTLFVFLILLVALAAAVNSAWFAEGALELRRSADAAALASTQQLLSDEWLRSNPDVAPLLEHVQHRAQEYAGFNLALGIPVQLLPNPTNDPNGDIVLGVGSPGGMTAADVSDPNTLTLDQVDTVAIQARRLASRGNAVPVLLGPIVLLTSIDLQAVSTAKLDRAVIGFRPPYSQNIPLVPLGIRSNPSGADPQSWEFQIIQRNGPDQYRYVPGQGFEFDPAGDGIPEITILLQPTGGDPSKSNAYLLTIGTGSTQDQVDQGVSSTDLQDPDLQGQLVLDSNNQLTLPGSAVGSPDQTQPFSDLTNCQQGQGLCGGVRIWPLVNSLDPSSGEATVTGFVGARVVQVINPPGGPLAIILQPGMLSVPSAVTDPSRIGAANVLLPNPYLAKIRLIH